MFFGMLLSTRAGLEAYSTTPNYGRLILWTVALLTVGGLLLGPIVQKYAFDAFWTGWPFGTDLTDNKDRRGLAGLAGGVAQNVAPGPGTLVGGCRCPHHAGRSSLSRTACSAAS